MSFLLGAGTLLGADAASKAADIDVQMMTSTYNQFTHMFFVFQTVALIEGLIVVFLFFVFKPYFPFVISKIFTHLPVVGIMNRVRNIAPFGGFTLRNGMYRREWKDNIMYYVKKYLGSYFFMGVPFDIVHIDRGFVQDPIMNKYIVSLYNLGYHNVAAVEDARIFNGIDPNGEDYHDEEGNVIGNTTMDIVTNMGYDSYQSAKKGINPSGLVETSLIYAPKYSNIPLDSLIGYGEEVGPGSIAAQVDDIFEYRKPPMEENKLFELLPIIMILVTLAISAAILISVIK